MSYVLGIDPGATGGICSLSVDRKQISLLSASENDADTVKSLLRLVGGVNFDNGKPVVAVVERVAAFKGQGVTSTFTFGKRYGVIRGFLLTLGIPMVDVPPQRWIKEVGLTIPPEKIPGETEKDKRSRRSRRRKEQKRRNLALASQLYPVLDGLDDETADAVLLAEYALRTLVANQPQS